MGMSIGPHVYLGSGKIVWPHTVSLGRACFIEDDVTLKSDGTWRPDICIHIGDSCFVGRGSEFNIRQGIRIGAHSAIASGCKFIDHDHGMSGERIDETPGREEPITIGCYVWLGANVIVLRGVSIGDGAVVGAGSIVTKSIPTNEIWAGTPAKRIGARHEIPVKAKSKTFAVPQNCNEPAFLAS